MRVLSLAIVVLLTAAACPPSRAETPVERGRYLAAIAACTGCHTPRTPDAALLSGGVHLGSGPSAAVSANITPDIETGIGAWSDRQIITALREGRRPDGTRIGPPMPQRAYAGLTDEDAAAIAAFLKSVRPAHNRVERRADIAPSSPAPRASTPTGDPRVEPRGRYLYEAVSHCAECHGQADTTNEGRLFQGAHGPVAAPALTPARLAALSDAQLEHLITTGSRPDGSRLSGPMPFAAYARLVPSDLSAIVDYLRGGVR